MHHFETHHSVAPTTGWVNTFFLVLLANEIPVNEDSWKVSALKASDNFFFEGGGTGPDPDSQKQPGVWIIESRVGFMYECMNYCAYKLLLGDILRISGGTCVTWGSEYRSLMHSDFRLSCHACFETPLCRHPKCLLGAKVLKNLQVPILLYVTAGQGENWHMWKWNWSFWTHECLYIGCKNRVNFGSFYWYPPVIKHGWLENGPFMEIFPYSKRWFP